MDNIILVLTCLTLGIIFNRLKVFPTNAYTTLNQFVIYISLPALSLYFIPKIELNATLLYPLGVAWITFFFSFILFYSLGKWLGWSKKLIGCLILTSGLGNTAFVGFPIIEALFGKEGLKTAIIIDQPGTFVILSTFGIATAAMFSRGKVTAVEISKKVITFPPFIAFVIACLMNFISVDFPVNLQSVFSKLGSTVTPIALVSVGMQLKFERKSKHWRFLFLGLGYKLFLIPSIIYSLYIGVLNQSGIEIQICILEAAMAPMITAAIVSANYGLKPRLSNMMIGFGIPISFITLLFWYYILI